MKKNTDLRDNVDEKYYFGEVKMWYEARKHKNYMGVLVEAKANEILFRKLFQPFPIVTFFAVQGWTKVVSILETAKKHSIDALIGIIDADFKRVLSAIPATDNLFLTDYHDTEIMMSLSDAWENMVNQYTDAEKLSNFETKKEPILDFILQLLKPISIMRFLKERYGLPLVFRIQKDGRYDYLKYKDFISTDTLAFDNAAFLKALENKSSKPGYFKQNSNIEKEWHKLMSDSSLDLKEYTNGHDLMNVLSIALESLIGNKKSSTVVSGEKIEEALCIAYRKTDFDKTELYKELKNWESNTGYKVLA